MTTSLEMIPLIDMKKTRNIDEKKVANALALIGGSMLKLVSQSIKRNRAFA